MTIQLEIPDDLVEFLVREGHDPARSILEDAVAEAYREDRLSMHLVSRLLDLADPNEVDKFLGKRQIYDDYTMEDLDRDTEVLRQLRARNLQAA